MKKLLLITSLAISSLSHADRVGEYSSITCTNKRLGYSFQFKPFQDDTVQFKGKDDLEFKKCVNTKADPFILGPITHSAFLFLKTNYVCNESVTISGENVVGAQTTVKSFDTGDYPKVRGIDHAREIVHLNVSVSGKWTGEEISYKANFDSWKDAPYRSAIHPDYSHITQFSIEVGGNDEAKIETECNTLEPEQITTPIFLDN